VSELSVLGTLLFSGPTARASCRCREESSSRRHCIYPMTCPMSLTALCIQSFPFALLESLSLGIDSGVEKRRKIPVKTKTMQIVNAFRAGSCKRIRLLIIWPNRFFELTICALPLVVFTSLCRQTCANPAQTVKLSLLLSAITEFNA